MTHNAGADSAATPLTCKCYSATTLQPYPQNGGSCHPRVSGIPVSDLHIPNLPGVRVASVFTVFVDDSPEHIS